MKFYKCFQTKIINNKKNITTEVFRKTSKLPVHWSSRIPKRYERDAVIGDLHRSKIISSNFEMEIKVIKRKFRNGDYRQKFLNSAIHQFFTPKNNDSFINPLMRVNHLLWLKYRIVKKTEMLPNILLINSSIYQSAL